MHFVYMLEFEASSEFIAETVLGELHESVLDIEESDIDTVKFGSQVLITDRRISDSDKEHERIRSAALDVYQYEGLNHNPLPDDFPKV